jgi:hypothetical protein
MHQRNKPHVFNQTMRYPPIRPAAKYSTTTGCYTDCFTTKVPTVVSFNDFATSFFTSPVFKLERFLIKFSLGKPTTQQDVTNFLSGKSDHFAVWQVEERHDNQLLLAVGKGQIRTWLMFEHVKADTNSVSAHTSLYFGSAVLPKDQNGRMGALFHALKGFHGLYSKILLWQARKGLA